LTLLALAVSGGMDHSFGKMEWSGVDEAVIGKSARETNRPAREAFINTGKGDLLLFFFVVAGAAGGL